MSPSATSTRLPQELIDSVIDEFRNDAGSLRICSLVSKSWVYRSRKHLFATVHLPTCLLRKWLERIPTNPITLSNPHSQVRSLSLQPAVPCTPFCIPKAFVGHLSSFTEVSKLAIASSLWGEWTNAFSDPALVSEYFGGLGRSLRKLELTRVYLNMVVLKTMLDVFPQLEHILIFSPMMVNEDAKDPESFPHLRERRTAAEAEGLPNPVVPCKEAPIRWVDSVALLFPPRELIVGLAGLPLCSRELVLAEDSDYGGETFNLLLESTGQTLESLVIRNTFDRDSVVTLEGCPVLRKLKTKAPYSGMLAYIHDQARLLQTITSPLLTQIVFLGKWDDSLVGRTIDWLDPMKWEVVDRELCSLIDRLDKGVKLEIIFADGALSGGREILGTSCELAAGAHSTLLNGMRKRGGIVRIQRGGNLK